MAKKDDNKQHKSSILGTMFDFNGDGYTDTFEAMTAYKEYEKRMRKNITIPTVNSAFFLTMTTTDK